VKGASAADSCTLSAGAGAGAGGEGRRARALFLKALGRQRRLGAGRWALGGEGRGRGVLVRSAHSLALCGWEAGAAAHTLLARTQVGGRRREETQPTPVAAATEQGEEAGTGEGRGPRDILRPARFSHKTFCATSPPALPI